MYVTFHLERTILRDMEAAIEEYIFEMDKQVTIALMNETWTSSLANALPIASGTPLLPLFLLGIAISKKVYISQSTRAVFEQTIHFIDDIGVIPSLYV